MVRLFINSALPGIYDVVTPHTTKRLDFEQLIHFIADECNEAYPLIVDDNAAITNIQDKVDQLGEAMTRVNGAANGQG